ncbi:MAG: hypothetical protein CL590_06675 [Alteromonadaceae bacterium]|nr:hypothetical protein [Alteromonadaceae bacterium]
MPLANNALAIRIIFPSVRVIQVSFNLTGLPASLGKQKRRHEGRQTIGKRSVKIPDAYLV